MVVPTPPVKKRRSSALRRLDQTCVAVSAHAVDVAHNYFSAEGCNARQYLALYRTLIGDEMSRPAQELPKRAWGRTFGGKPAMTPSLDIILLMGSR
ncbi:MAG: hypothetical protein R2932_26140 [Caldilineaceae bacterium]